MQNTKIVISRQIGNERDLAAGLQSQSTQVSTWMAFHFLINQLTHFRDMSSWELFGFDNEAMVIRIVKGPQKGDTFTFAGKPDDMAKLFTIVYTAMKLQAAPKEPADPILFTSLSRFTVPNFTASKSALDASINYIRHRAGAHVTGAKRNLSLVLLGTRLAEAIPHYDGSQVAKAFSYRQADMVVYFLDLAFFEELPLPKVVEHLNGDRHAFSLF